MNYPNDFDTDTYNSGRSIAISRIMAVWSMVLFFIIICISIVIIFVAKSNRTIPIILAPDWTMINSEVGIIRDNNFIFQESVALNFTKNWFSVSETDSINQNNFGECIIDECGKLNYPDYNICCSASGDVYEIFSRTVLPTYTLPTYIDENSIKLTPIGTIDNDGGVWRAELKVNGDDVIAFIKIRRNEKLYSRTLGFYVAAFNAYKI